MAEKPSAITGTGTVNDPYIVHNYDEIKWACEDESAVPEGQTASIPVYLKLNNNIDCQEYDQDFEWSISCTHALDIDLNNKTIKTFYIVAYSYMFVIPATASNFSLHDGAILNVYGNWFNPSYAVFNYNYTSTNILSITNVSFSINLSQFTNSTGCLVNGGSAAHVQFTNCALTLEGSNSQQYLAVNMAFFTCDFMLNITPKYTGYLPWSSCVAQDCRVQGLIDYSALSTVSNGYFANSSVARNCVVDIEIRVPTTWTSSVPFFYSPSSSYNYGIYNKDKLPDNYTFDNTTYIECTTYDMDMRVNPHADTTLQEKGFDVIKG